VLDASICNDGYGTNILTAGDGYGDELYAGGGINTLLGYGRRLIYL